MITDNSKILSNYNIGILASVPEREYWTKTDIDLAINEFVADFSSTVFKYGGRIVLCFHPIFVSIIMRQAEIHSKNRLTPPVTLIRSKCWEETWEYNKLSDYGKLATIITTDNIDKNERNNLTLIHKELIKEINALVILGGKRNTNATALSDVEEQLCFALKRDLPVFAIGNTGGMVDELLKTKEIKEAVFESNLMPETQNNELLDSEDVIYAAGFILGHVTRKREALCSRMLKDIEREEACPALKKTLQDLQLPADVENSLSASVEHLSWHTQIGFLNWLKKGVDNEQWDARELISILKDESLDLIKSGDKIENIAAQALTTARLLFDGLNAREKIEPYLKMLMQLDNNKIMGYDLSNIAFEFALRANEIDRENLILFYSYKEQMRKANYIKEDSVKCYLLFIIDTCLDIHDIIYYRQSPIDIIKHLLYFDSKHTQREFI